LERKIYVNMVGLALLTIMLTTAATLFVCYEFFTDELRNVLQREAEMVAYSLNNTKDKLEVLQDVHMQNTGSRITLIDPLGKVLFDNHVNPGEWEDHSNRPEIVEALETGRGEASRYSGTIQKQTDYYAIRLKDGSVLRLANTTGSFVPFLFKILVYLFFVGLIILFLSSLLAYRLTQKIVKPIYAIDLENPKNDFGYDELVPFLLRIKEQNKLIEAHIQSLAAEKDTINAIVGNMREGLVLLDGWGKILVVNKSAANMLGVPTTGHIGQPFVFMTRNTTLGQAVEQALQGTHSDGLFKVGDRDYQYLANPVYENHEIDGAVLLLFDATEEQRSQRLRREFSANVSHELKTPLTAISGYAEIVESGMADPRDIENFAGKIRSEASRLLSLIDDIIKLSKLDESVGGREFKPVSLLDSARYVAERLQEKAQANNVEINIEGDHASVAGEKNMIEDLIFNLLDNAIKYNKPEGSINVLVCQVRDKVTLTVRDTGIGIPKEDLNRVFERFYRADKNHSKKIVGTGLGLAIVKHIAQYHSATLEIKSEENIGTTVVVNFSAPGEELG
jgi:two-component system phosphate regulon sensor histidine kinase PhoR